MILLDTENLAILNVLQKKSVASDSGKFETVDAKLADDDGIMYHIHTNPDDKAKIFVDVTVSFHQDLKGVKVAEYLSGVYKAGWVAPPNEAHFRMIHDCGLGEKEKDESCMKIALFRRNLYAGILSHLFSKPTTGKQICLGIRTTHLVTFNAYPDRVTVTYTFAFKDKNDVIISRVFLQEFKEGKKSAKNAPSVIVTFKDLPSELEGIKRVPVGPDVAHITFVLTETHNKGDNFLKTVNAISNFAPFQSFHLSGIKAYMHSRMRLKTESFIKIVNRARPESSKPSTKSIGRSAGVKG